MMKITISKKHLRCITAAALFAGFGSQVMAACPVSIDVTKADTNYLDNGDGTVTDNETDLMWQQCAAGLSGASCASGSASVMTWKEALEYAQSQNGSVAFGYTDWRVPNVKELATLIERQCETPAINTTVFAGAPSMVVWTSTPDVSVGANALSVDLTTGVDSSLDKATDQGVWLVRDR